jgi:hypothetical protein
MIFHRIFHFVVRGKQRALGHGSGAAFCGPEQQKPVSR